VLTDVSTAGAGEILAAAFANTKRGDIVGERTFGMASDQKLITVDDGSALILTVANYYNADGKTILEEGVAPTEVVHAASAPSDDADGEDVSAAPANPKDQPVTPKPLSVDDPVLRKAIELMKTPTKKAA